MILHGIPDADGHRYYGERCRWCGVNIYDHAMYEPGERCIRPAWKYPIAILGDVALWAAGWVRYALVRWLPHTIRSLFRKGVSRS